MSTESGSASTAPGIRLLLVGGLVFLGFLGGFLLGSSRNASPVEVSDATAEPTNTTTSTSTTTPSTTATTEPPEVFTGALFVSSTGDDANSGWAEETSLRSISVAIDRAGPGDSILIAPGTYPPLLIAGRSDLSIEALDPATPPEFSSGTYDAEAGIEVLESSNIRLSGLTARTSLFGIAVRSSTSIEIEAATVHDLGQEGILVQFDSSDVTIRDSTVFNTGNRPGGNGQFAYSEFGEGIYIGSGSGRTEDGTFDTTNGVRIENNTIYATTAEAIDIKHSAFDITAIGNLIYDIDTSTSGAVVVGIGDRLYDDPQVVIERNVIYNISRTSQFRDGNAITISAPATVVGNVIWNTEHFGIFIDPNLDSSNGGEVRVEDNIISSTGLTPVEDESPGSVAVILRNNTVDTQADELLADKLTEPQLLIEQLRLGALTTD